MSAQSQRTLPVAAAKHSVYCARAIDAVLEEALSSPGRLLVVLGPPGSGKSSLLHALAEPLRRTSHHLAIVMEGSTWSGASTQGLLCRALLQTLAPALGLPGAAPFLAALSTQHKNPTPTQRLLAFFQQVSPAEQITLLFDDLQLLSVELRAFLLGVLAQEAGRAGTRFSFCLAAGTDLTSEVAQHAGGASVWALPDLGLEELSPFSPLLAGLTTGQDPATAAQVTSTYLAALLEHTGGRPALMQALCHALPVHPAAVETESPRAQVEALIEALYPHPASASTGQGMPRAAVPNLGDLPQEALFLRGEQVFLDHPARDQLLALWRRLWRGEVVRSDASDPLQRALWLAGLSASPLLVPLRRPSPLDRGGEPLASGRDAIRVPAGPFQVELPGILRPALPASPLPTQAAPAAHGSDSMETAELRLRPSGRLFLRLFSDDWCRSMEARALLDRGEKPTGEPAGDGPAARAGIGTEGAMPRLRGATLRSAVLWAQRNPQRLQPDQVLLLLAELEQARQEADTKQQQTALILQRESRERSTLRAEWQRTHSELVEARDRLLWQRRVLLAIVVLLAMGLLGAIVWRLGFPRTAQRDPLLSGHAPRYSAMYDRFAEPAFRTLVC